MIGILSGLRGRNAECYGDDGCDERRKGESLELDIDRAPIPQKGRTRASIDTSSVVPRTASAVPRTRTKGFAQLFSMLSSEDIRTKPSYTDCWLTNPPDGLRPIASYMTPDGSVTIGESDEGWTEYNITPREYAYPDGLNSVVMDAIDGIRESYRESGGLLDRDSIAGMCMSVLTDRIDDIQAACGPGGADAVMEDICRIAYRYSVGPGMFEILLSDPHIEDIYVDSPASRNRVHVTVNGIQGLNSHIRCRTNLMVEDREVDNLVNILRRQSGLRFCRSNPVMECDFRGYDARVTVMGYPMSPNGNAVAIRKRSSRPWTLTRMIANGTVDPRSAGILSYLVNNRAAILICGARGAGKSSMLSALLMDMDTSTRILTIEDTMEIDGDLMRRLGYKVQTILVDERMQGTQLSRSDEALRASLRMGESAIALGEVRGEEARTLYQSMRAGRAGNAILGTIHGDSADSVYRRVVFDLGISPEAFMATDVVVTMGTVRDRRSGNLIRRVNELMSVGESPGKFVDLTDPEAMMSSPVMKRAMSSSQGGRRAAAKEIRARSMMRSLLAELGSEDERYLGPEWVILANETLSSMDESSSAEQVLNEFKRRLGVMV